MNTPTRIATKSLDLIPYEPAHLRALFHGAEEYERCSGHKVAPGLLQFYHSDAVRPEWRAKLERATAPDPWAFGFAVFHHESMTLIGSAGFVNAPGTDGVVELAYGIAPEYQGKGYATEAAAALVPFAFSTAGVRVVRAHTLPQVNASTRILTKCGFTRVADFLDPVDGLVWRWEKEQPKT